MTGGEFLLGLVLFFVALGAVLEALKWVLKQLGRAVRAVAPFAIMVFGAFILFALFKSDAANAATVSVPAGLVVGALRASMIGF